tara:strand:+ start:1020 stop:2021 length:1002 start_codon:yes stop_codon:yes gene_type:complete
MLLGKSVKKIFLTGGAGFIGSHIVDWLLKEGYKITVFDNLSNGRKDFLEHHFSNPNLKFCEADITNINSIIDKMKDHDLVWHLAANTDIIGGVEKPSRDLNDCVIGTFNILESMRKLDIKNIIFSSTGAVYGDLCLDVATSEEGGPLLPVSTYAAGKIGSEAFISSYAHLYGIRGWIFRFGNVIGARMTHGVIYDFIKKLKNNPKELLIRGNGLQEKNYFLVEECIDGMAWAFRNINLSESYPCDIFNLGTDTVTKVTKIAEIVKEELGLREAKIIIEGTERAWPGDQPKVHITIDKMRKLGWSSRYNSDFAVRVATQRMIGKAKWEIGKFGT